MSEREISRKQESRKTEKIEKQINQAIFDERCKSKTDFETWRMNKDYDNDEKRREERKRLKLKNEEIRRSQDERGDPKEQFMSWVMEKENKMLKQEELKLKRAKQKKTFTS